MAISETKGQGWRAIPTQYRKASDILTSTLAMENKQLQHLAAPVKFISPAVSSIHK